MKRDDPEKNGKMEESRFITVDVGVSSVFLLHGSETQERRNATPNTALALLALLLVAAFCLSFAQASKLQKRKFLLLSQNSKKR
jgi:hypothetical protein